MLTWSFHQISQHVFNRCVFKQDAVTFLRDRHLDIVLFCKQHCGFGSVIPLNRHSNLFKCFIGSYSLPYQRTEAPVARMLRCAGNYQIADTGQAGRMGARKKEREEEEKVRPVNVR